MLLESEILFTQDEITQIENFAKNNPIYKNEFIFSVGNDIKTLLKISFKNNLLLAKGNLFTGFEHIHHRHEFWTIDPTFKDNPSRFNKNSIPFLDYIKIADDIFHSNNLKIEKNKRPELFDLYIGYREDSNKTVTEYKLLTYKNSKVIHALFPTDKKNNTKSPNKFKYKRGFVTIENISNDELIKIPYLDLNQKIKYMMLIHKIRNQNIEKAILIIHDEKGQASHKVDFDERTIDGFESQTHELFYYQYHELTAFEDFILKTEKQISK